MEERETIILAVGRLVRLKGFDLLLKAFAQLHSAHPTWRLIILGEGPERQALEALRKELGLVNHFELPGQVRNPEAWMARAGLVVQPSRYEGFPNAVLEAMAMGAPVISSDCRCGPSEMIKDGVNGRLVPVDDIAALARVMGDLLSRKDERERLGHAAVAVRCDFSMDRIMPRWEGLLVGHETT
jgi:glycosyltransferase involved in cell wall biosynthesis